MRITDEERSRYSKYYRQGVHGDEAAIACLVAAGFPDVRNEIADLRRRYFDANAEGHEAAVKTMKAMYENNWEDR